MADEIGLAEPFRANNDVEHPGNPPCYIKSENVRSVLRKYETSGQRKLATRKGLIRIELTLAAKQASAEAVDNAHHRIEAIKQATDSAGIISSGTQRVKRRVRTVWRG